MTMLQFITKITINDSLNSSEFNKSHADCFKLFFEKLKKEKNICDTL